MHLLLSVERAAVEDEKIVLRSGGFLAVDPEPFYRRLASAWLDLRGSGTKESPQVTRAPANTSTGIATDTTVDHSTLVDSRAFIRW